MLQAVAYFASFLFVAATLAQTIKTVKEGHADGLAHVLIWMLNLGFCIMIYYTIEKLNSDPVMLFAYIGQLTGFVIMTKYKYFPKRKGL